MVTKYCVLPLVLAAMAASSPAFAARGDFSEGFNPQSVEQFVQGETKFTGASAASKRRFTAAANMGALIRDELAKNNVGGLRAQLEGRGADRLGLLLPPGSDKEMEKIWGEFFTGAVTLIGAGVSDAPVVGFYNPMVDGWIVTSFSRGEKGLTLTGLVPLTGENMRELAGVKLPGSTKYKSPLLPTYKASSDAFEKLYPVTSSKAATLRVSGNRFTEYDTITTRVIQMDGIVSVAMKQSALADSLAAFEKAALRGNALELRQLFGANTTTPPEWLAAISKPVRAGLKPAAIYKRGDGVQVAYVSPVASRVVVLVDLDGNAALSDIIVSDYAYISGSK